MTSVLHKIASVLVAGNIIGIMAFNYELEYNEVGDRTWTHWANDDHTTQINCTKGAFVYGINVQKWEGYGLVGMRISCSDDKRHDKSLTRDTYNFNDDGTWLGQKISTTGFSAIEVDTQYNYGLVNARLSDFNSTNIQKFYTNTDGEGRWLNCTEGEKIIGIEALEFLNYGMINIRIQCAKFEEDKTPCLYINNDGKESNAAPGSDFKIGCDQCTCGSRGKRTCAIMPCGKCKYTNESGVSGKLNVEAKVTEGNKTYICKRNGKLVEHSKSS